MKLVFINPPGPRYLYRGAVCTYISKARYVWKPKDFILLSSIVPADWDVSFLDAAINQLPRQEVLKWASNERPDAIVLAMSSIVWETDLQFLQQLRQTFAGAKIIVFGEVFLEPRFVEMAKPWINGIIFDPLRSKLPELAQRTSNEILPCAFGKKDVQELKTFPARHKLFDNFLYRWPFVKHFKFASVYTQFGCPFTCSYCTESLTDVTWRPADNVLEEMAYLKREGYKELLIGDASFGYPRHNAAKLIEGMIRENFGFIWSSYIYPGLADPAMLESMARSGCHTLVIGIDSADGKLLEKYGRHLPQGKIRDFIAECRKNHIDVCGDLIIGFKEDTMESCLRTIELAVELDLDYASFNVATPMMGSSIRKEYQDMGLLQKTDTGFDTAGLRDVIGTASLTGRDMIWLRTRAIERFYLRPSYIWKRLRKSASFEEILIKLNEAFGIILNWARQKRTLRSGRT
ncbi:MAG: radical SAM protein [Elusimicrobia bacterium]|nr:radical SAM protein [Elusimicrobiota bacterium]